MAFIEQMWNKAKSLRKNLVLPEGTDPRMMQAARRLLDEQLVGSVTLLGSESEIAGVAEGEGVKLDGIQISDPSRSGKLEQYSQAYYELRKHKGLELDQAKHDITEPLRWGAIMVREGDADAMVAGAVNSTGNVLRAALSIIKTAPDTKYASSCFVMRMPDEAWGADGHMIFADCATIPDPDPEQLASIAVSAAESCRTYLQTEPIVAMLSFSTKGSASHPAVEKVVSALKIAQEQAPKLQIDGELQADAAIVPRVGSSKAPGSSVAGKANVLVFPDLNSGNIGYKLVQRLAGAEAYGPFLQGFAKPVSDLSRGCSVDDIVNTSAVTLCQGGQ